MTATSTDKISNGGVTKTVIGILLGGLVVLAWGIALGAIKGDVRHIETNQVEIRQEQKLHSDKLGRHDTDIMVTKNNIESIKAMQTVILDEVRKKTN